MNGTINIYFNNTSTTTELTNILVEKFQDGTMIHADGFVMTIPDIDVAAAEHTEKEDRYWLKNETKVVLTWS